MCEKHFQLENFYKFQNNEKLQKLNLVNMVNVATIYTATELFERMRTFDKSMIRPELVPHSIQSSARNSVMFCVVMNGLKYIQCYSIGTYTDGNFTPVLRLLF